jgi:flagellar basal body-associated protein FliL
MKGKRNRIVIDLNQPAGGPRRRARSGGGSRLGRVLILIGIVLALIVVALAAGGYFWWQHFKSQPSYTLALLVDAAQRDDKPEMDRILNMDKIAENFIGEVRSRLTTGSLLNSVLPSQVDQVVAKITPQLKETLREALPGEIQRVTEPAKGKPFILIALSVPYFADVKQNGNAATADMKAGDEQIQLVLQQQGDGSWRIEAIRDDRLTNIIVDTARNGLTDRGSHFQEELQKRLNDWKLPGPSPSR